MIFAKRAHIALRLRPIICLGATLLLLSCSSSGAAPEIEFETAIEVDPNEFLSPRACRDNKVHVYVATLVDTTDDGARQVAPPSHCSSPVRFTEVQPDSTQEEVSAHSYFAEIQLYDRPVVRGAAGSSKMVDPDSGEPVAPRWAGQCGLGTEGEVSLQVSDYGDNANPSIEADGGIASESSDSGAADSGAADSGAADSGAADSDSGAADSGTINSDAGAGRAVDAGTRATAPNRQSNGDAGAKDAAAASELGPVYGGLAAPVYGRTVVLRGCKLTRTAD